jgi:hypothetical protein
MTCQRRRSWASQLPHVHATTRVCGVVVAQHPADDGGGGSVELSTTALRTSSVVCNDAGTDPDFAVPFSTQCCATVSGIVEGKLTASDMNY